MVIKTNKGSEERLCKLERQIEVLKEELDTANAKNRELVVKNNELAAKNKELDAKCEELNSKLAEIGDLKKKIANLEKPPTTPISRFKQRVQELFKK